MIASQSQNPLSPEDYLESEKSSPIKHEYIQGQIYAISGASDAHVTITANLVTLLRNHLRGSGYKVYPTDMKVNIESLNV
ncbi:MAG: Uma2 family endonuclease, partial [Spirulinaceae cyanobacterium]